MKIKSDTCLALYSLKQAWLYVSTAFKLNLKIGKQTVEPPPQECHVSIEWPFKKVTDELRFNLKTFHFNYLKPVSDPISSQGPIHWSFREFQHIMRRSPMDETETKGKNIWI